MGANRSTSSSSAAGTTGSSRPGYLRQRRKRSPCARAAVGGRRRRGHRAAVGPRLQGDALSYVVSLMPPTIVRELRAGAARLQASTRRTGYFVPYARRPVPAAPRRRPARAARRSRSSRRTTPTRIERWDAWLGGLADVLGPLLDDGPARARLAPARRPARAGSAGVAAARARRARRRRRHPAVHDEHRRPARRVLRVAADAGRAVGERRHRHVGRTALAGHRVRDGAPQDRRRRRRAARAWGFPEGGMGGVTQALRGAARSFGATIRTDGAGRRASTCATAA